MPPTEGLTDGKAAIPLYQQVIDIIKNEINSGAYKAGARIPNEFELAESYKVGRVIPCDALLRSSSSRAI